VAASLAIASFATNVCADTDPDPFSFPYQGFQPRYTLMTSDPATITGIDEPAPVMLVPLLAVDAGQPVAVGDFEADGKADLLFATAAGLQRYRMDGTAVLDVELRLGPAVQLDRIRDFDGDGRVDRVFFGTLSNETGVFIVYEDPDAPAWYADRRLIMPSTDWKLH
jgi:hypothetical protein